MQIFGYLLIIVLASGLHVTEARSQAGTSGSYKEDVIEYKNSLQKNIALKMREARYFSISGGTVVAYIKVDRSGKVTDHSLLRSSGDPHIDRAAMKALGTGIQFPPFPATIKAPWMDVSFPVRFPPR